MTPVFEKMSYNMQEVVFVKVNVDENPEVADNCGIEAMPTFILFRKG
jgi:thioredoxin 1